MSNEVPQEYLDSARALGIQHALAAAGWAVDGDTTAYHARRMLAMLEEGDPEAYDYLPREPNLSGEYADDPTPLSLARDITGEDDPDPDTIDALADAYEDGVAEAFSPACESALRALAGVQS